MMKAWLLKRLKEFKLVTDVVSRRSGIMSRSEIREKLLERAKEDVEKEYTFAGNSGQNQSKLGWDRARRREKVRVLFETWWNDVQNPTPELSGWLRELADANQARKSAV